MKTMELCRDWFVTNQAGDNEFDYLLRELKVGNSDGERESIEVIWIDLVKIQILSP